ncbi:nSTAND3 domain-containing NTPase [Lactococcus petauri]|uniref:Novel STAND NTPase 3 domain-containing protein n=1 Tax=Lactococcus petauri TaxID=1940789 RepID=A0AAJ2J059_9LACT|nr:hypothetical protein [Lactococcus petauri]MDT2527144.1 hypothetical protein [Lactococcus petauri]MDT2541741.1 hypothetical protein [Lactococcus petauri]MDT2560449.1 hypothetical protein [Lactococcus petauri]MDT2568969.1 hypothetical protein [Lactococcus petauri]MDT2587931.1 hypothetical protein [Lactococcus petauri]
MDIKDMLQKSGNISITGTPGSGKTALLKMFVKEAIELGKYDSIRVYTSKVNRIEWEEFLKEKTFKLKKFPKVSLLDPLFTMFSSSLVSKKCLVIVDGYDIITNENVTNGNIKAYRLHLEDTRIRNELKGRSSPIESLITREKSDEELAEYIFNKELDKYIRSDSTLCISNQTELRNFEFGFHQKIAFSALLQSYSTGQFEYSSILNLNDYLQENEEEYWGDY